MEDNKKEPGGERPETLDGIVVDILDRAVVADRHGARETSNESVAALLRDIANRIKAAATREREAASLRAIHAVEIAIRDAAPGNAAALREALVVCKETMCGYCRDCYDDMPCVNGCETLRIAKAALAKPPRNCDVGTAEEQYRRFMTMCNSKDAKQCSTCMFRQNCYTSRDKCFARWAQLPYEAEKGGAE